MKKLISRAEWRAVLSNLTAHFGPGHAQAFMQSTFILAAGAEA